VHETEDYEAYGNASVVKLVSTDLVSYERDDTADGQLSPAWSSSISVDGVVCALSSPETEHALEACPQTTAPTRSTALTGVMLASGVMFAPTRRRSTFTFAGH
jgi:hypothetical protein